MHPLPKWFKHVVREIHGVHPGHVEGHHQFFSLIRDIIGNARSTSKLFLILFLYVYRQILGRGKTCTIPHLMPFVPVVIVSKGLNLLFHLLVFQLNLLFTISIINVIEIVAELILNHHVCILLFKRLLVSY